MFNSANFAVVSDNESAISCITSIPNDLISVSNKNSPQYSCNVLNSHSIIELLPSENVAVATVLFGKVLAKCCVDTGAGRNYIS